MQAVDLAILRLKASSTGSAPTQQHLSNGGKGPEREFSVELQVLREEVFRIWEQSSSQ